MVLNVPITRKIRKGETVNRQERRKAAKQGIDHKLIRNVELQTQKKAVNQTTNYCIASALMVLRDRFGFGETRAKRFMGCFSEVFEDVSAGRISFNDLLVQMEEELNITFNVKGE